MAKHLQATDESYSIILRDISTRSAIAKRVIRMLRFMLRNTSYA